MNFKIPILNGVNFASIFGIIYLAIYSYTKKITETLVPDVLKNLINVGRFDFFEFFIIIISTFAIGFVIGLIIELIFKEKNNL